MSRAKGPRRQVATTMVVDDPHRPPADTALEGRVLDVLSADAGRAERTIARRLRVPVAEVCVALGSLVNQRRVTLVASTGLWFLTPQRDVDAYVTSTDDAWGTHLRAYVAGAFAARDPKIPPPVVEYLEVSECWTVTHGGRTWAMAIGSDDDDFCFHSRGDVFTFPAPGAL